MVLILISVAAACSQRRAFPDDDRTNVVAPFYALAEAARQVGGNDVRVIDITPPGVEPHDIELSSRQVERIQEADVVVVMGGDFQPAVTRAARRAKGEVVTVDVDGDDPHVWLDPIAMQGIVAKVAAAIPGASPEGFTNELAAIHEEYRTGLADCDRRTVVTAHDAFGRLAARYDLDVHAIAGISPEAEPNARRLAELTDLVRQTGTTTVFTEELVSPKVAEALAREAGVRTERLDPLESGRPGRFGATMRENLRRLRAALGCR